MKNNLDKMKAKNDRMANIFKRGSSGLDVNSNCFKIMKEDHLQYSKEYTRIDSLINDFIRIEMLFKELTHIISQQYQVDKNMISVKLSTINKLVEEYSNKSNKNALKESDNKENFDNCGKLNNMLSNTFNTTKIDKFSNTATKFTFDKIPQDSGRIFGNLLSLSIRQNSVHNSYLNSTAKNKKFH